MSRKEVDMRRRVLTLPLVAMALFGWTMHAASIRALASAGAGGGSMSEAKPAAKTSTGTVESVSGSSLTVTAAGKDMTFTIDNDTKVIGKGMGTKSAAAGGKLAIADAVSTGDTVSVTYHDMGGTMHAATVRVTTKASGSSKR